MLAGAVGLAAVACGPAPQATPPPTSDAPKPAPPFQPGVLDAPPAATEFLAVDVTVPDKSALSSLWQRLSRHDRPDETVTVSAGASLYDQRYGLTLPAGLTRMPAFPSDVLDEAWCHGDLSVQVCAATPERARALADELAATPGLRPRWRLAGFRQDNGVDAAGKPTATNLFGFREGAGNPEPGLLDGLIRSQHGGTFQVVRLIRFAMPLWDADPLPKQEQVFGRRKDNGAPLGMRSEADEPDYAKDPGGQIIALDSHIRRANPRTPEAMANRVHRRGYSYRRTADAAGYEDAGLLFICYQRDVELGFAAVQRRLGGEALQKYVLPFGGGYFYTPPKGVSITS